jgi:hypothetical protein
MCDFIDFRTMRAVASMVFVGNFESGVGAKEQEPVCR